MGVPIIEGRLYVEMERGLPVDRENDGIFRGVYFGEYEIMDIYKFGFVQLVVTLASFSVLTAVGFFSILSAQITVQNSLFT